MRPNPDGSSPMALRGIFRGLRSWWLPGLFGGALLSVQAQAQLPDLVVRLQAPAEAVAGEDIGAGTRILVANLGQRVARGTDSATRGGYMVDLFPSRHVRPGGFARFSEQYHDGVLLRGGRVSNTVDLAPGARRRYRIGGGLPQDTPPGSYRLCARVDPGQAVAESDEGNNLDCRPLRIRRLEVLPAEGPRPVDPQGPGAKVEHSVLPDGTLQTRYPDGRVRRLQPNGRVVTMFPDGRVMAPIAIQVQPASLPALPTELADWGSRISDSLLSIIRGLLSDAEFEAYLQTEQGRSFYELLDWRLRSIRFLTATP